MQNEHIVRYSLQFITVLALDVVDDEIEVTCMEPCGKAGYRLGLMSRYR